MKSSFEMIIIAEKKKEYLDLKKILEIDINIKIRFLTSFKLLKRHESELLLIILICDNQRIIEDTVRFYNSSSKNFFFLCIYNDKVNISSLHKFTLIKYPFHIGELINNIRKMLRKINSNLQLVGIKNYFYSKDDLTLRNKNSKKIIKLTDMENRFIDYLINSDKPVEKKEILLNVWKHQIYLETHTLESLVYRLRNKIEKDPKNPDIIISEGSKYLLKTY